VQRPAIGKELACQLHQKLIQAVLNLSMPHWARAPGKLKILQYCDTLDSHASVKRERARGEKAWSCRNSKQSRLSSHTEPTKTFLSLGHLFRGATDIRIVSDLMASLEHTSKINTNIIKTPHVNTYAFSTPKMQRLETPAILVSLRFPIRDTENLPHLRGRRALPSCSARDWFPGPIKEYVYASKADLMRHFALQPCQRQFNQFVIIAGGQLRAESCESFD
jgi:hypothetical protein